MIGRITYQSDQDRDSRTHLPHLQSPMHIRAIKVNNLHGGLNLAVEFPSDINLMVGINGAGKTSILNCIEVLLRPDLRRLATLEYEEIELTFELKGKPHTLTAVKTRKHVTLSIEAEGLDMRPIRIDLNSRIDPEDEEAAAYYSNLSPEPHEVPLWDFLSGLPRPIVISLDRTISAETKGGSFFEAPRARGAVVRRAQSSSPLSYVEAATSSAYAFYRRRAIAADEELKAEIVMSALQEPDFLSHQGLTRPLDQEELAHLEGRVIGYLSKTVKSEDVERQVKAFFKTTASLARVPGHPERDLLLDIVGSRYRQIESLAQAFNKYEQKITAAFRKLSIYLSEVNNFFRDSGKELLFDESTGKLYFSFVRNGERLTKKKGIDHLSSGERQILILFTFLAFAPNRSTTFIIDEPELSLHPKWQHEFLDAFLKLKPQNAQVLIATHSPEIVGRYRSACVPLRRHGV